MTETVGYLPGDAWLVSGVSALVLTGGAATVARGYWDLVRSDVPAADLIGGVQPGPDAGDLAVLVWESSGVRVLVRGHAIVRALDAAGGPRTVTAAGLLTWREELLAGVVDVEAVLAEHDLPSGAPDDADLLPVPAGVVRASYARRRSAPSGRLDAGDTAYAPSARAGHRAEDAGDRTEDAEDRAEGVKDRAEDADAGADDGEHQVDATAGAVQTGADPDVVVATADVVVADSVDRADSADSADSADEVVGDDAVTVISTVPAPGAHLPPARGVPTALEPAAVPRPSAEDPDAATGAARHRAGDVTQSVPLDDDGEPLLDRAFPVPPEPGPVGPTLVGPPSHPEPVPGSVLAGSAPQPPAPILGDHDGITELAENLPPGFVPPPLPPPLAAGWVYASVCPQGHANQPHAGNCRVCGQPIPPGEPVVAPQPLLGRLRFSTGELIDLDRRVIIGRAPSVSRVSSSELPRLVTVPSPQQDISRSHAEVRIEDWHLVVADLHSTNGTVLRAPDRPERLLHPGQEMVVEPGWTVDLGDGVTVTVEAAG